MFIELPQVTRSLGHLDEILRQLQNELMEKPDKGALLAGTGGCRKIRVRREGQGKSGGGRMIYIYFPDLAVIVFLLYYEKARQETLPSTQEKVLKDLATGLRNEIATNHEKYEKSHRKRNPNR